MSYPQQMPQAGTPSSKPAVPQCDPPQLNLPPSLPKQTYMSNVDGNDQHSDYPSAPVARSLTNNDHSLIPSSMNNSNGIKMGQSPTIFSILSSSDGGNTMSYRAQGTSMVASSRAYVSTTMPTQGSYQPQQQQQQQYNNNQFAQQQQQQPMYNQQPQYIQQQQPQYMPQSMMSNEIQDDDDDFSDDDNDDENDQNNLGTFPLPFPFQ